MGRNSEELYLLALEAQTHWLGIDQAAWLDRLDEEREPLHSLLEQWIELPDPERALQLAGALSPFWWMRGHTPLVES